MVTGEGIIKKKTKPNKAAIWGIKPFFGTAFLVKCNMMFICRAINLITKVKVNLG